MSRFPRITADEDMITGEPPSAADEHSRSQAEISIRARALLAQQQQQEQLVAAVAHRQRQQQQQELELLLRRREAEEVAGSGVIPIGYFRDPRGNAWAASLQHPSHAYLAAAAASATHFRAVNAAAVNAAAAISAAAANAQIQPPRNDVITIDDDDDEEEEEEETAATTTTTATAGGGGGGDDTSTAEPKDSEPRPGSSEAVPASADDRSGVTSRPAKRKSPAVLHHHPPPSKKTRDPNVEMRLRHARALRAAHEGGPKPVARRPIQVRGAALAGPFVNKWLHTSSVSAVDKDNETRAAIGKILYAATGFTNESPPASIPFPPERIFLDLDAIEEIAGGFVDDRNQMVGDAVRRAYSEMKSRHDEAIMQLSQSPPPTKQENAAYRKEMRSVRKAHEQEKQKIQNEHKVEMANLKAQLTLVKAEVDKLKEQADHDRREHASSVEALVQAGLSTLRSIRRPKTSQ